MVASAAAASPGERANERRSSARRRRSRAASRARRRSSPARASSGLARREALDVDAGRAEAGAVLRPSGRPSRPTGSRRCGASRRGSRARAPRPSCAYGLKRGCGLTVYSSALPWIFTAYGTPSSRRAGEHDRAHHEVVGERHVGPHALGDLAHRGHVGVDVAVDLLPARGPGTAAPRCPRSGRRRRAAAGRRCRAGRRSPAPARAASATSSAPASQSPAASTHSSASGSRSWHSRWTSWPAAHQRLGQRRVVDVRAGPGQQVAVEDQHAHGAPLYGLAVPGRC